MAVSFLNIRAEVWTLLNALSATSNANMDTAYASARADTLAPAEIVTTDWPRLQVEDAILDTELEIIKAIALADNHPERADFHKVSATIGSGSALPLVANDAVPAIPGPEAAATPFIGKFSSVIDSVNSRVLTNEPDIRKVQWLADNEDSMFPVRPSVYSLQGHLLYYYCPNPVFIKGPGAAHQLARLVSYATTRPSFTTLGNIRLRDHHRPGIVSGAMVKLLPKEGAWLEAFNQQAGLYKAHLDMIIAGGSAFVASVGG